MSDLIVEPLLLLLPPEVQQHVRTARAREAADNLRAKFLAGDGAAQAGLPRRYRRPAERNRARIVRKATRRARHEAEASADGSG